MSENKAIYLVMKNDKPIRAYSKKETAVDESNKLNLKRDHSENAFYYEFPVEFVEA